MTASPVNSRIANFGRTFETVYGRAPSVWVEAPGRINLIGEHIDYLDGCVMPAAINRHLTMLASPTNRPEIRVWSAIDVGKTHSISLSDLSRRTAPEKSWLNYLVGVLSGYREAGLELPGFEAAIFSDLPSGAGLSSSAALETSTALTLESLTGVSRDVTERALICQKAEHEFAGVPCGIMDQLAVGASRAGHATPIDCLDLSLRPVKIPDGIAILVADTEVKHSLGDGEYRKRREDCEKAREILAVDSLRNATLKQVEASRKTLGDRLFQRARHAVTEMARVEQFADALEFFDSEKIGTLMRGSHDSLRDDFEVSCPELDALVEEAYEFGQSRGLLGSRMTGGGFGGSTVSLVRGEAAPELQVHLKNAFEKRFGRTIEPFITEAAGGARILESPR